MRTVFARPGFGRLFAALATSALGDWLLMLVLAVWVKELTGSNGLAGLTFFFTLAPSLAGPLLGTWADRVRRRPLAVWGNLASAVALLPLLAVRGAGDVWIIWSVAVFYGMSEVVLPVAHNGLLKELVPEDSLADANGVIQTAVQGFRVFAPLVGTLIFAAGGGWVVALLDAVSFVAAALLIAGIGVAENAPERGTDDLRGEMLTGFRHLAGDRILARVLVGFCVMLLVIGFAESTVYAVLDFFGYRPTFVGVVVTVQGVGAIAGGLLSGRMIKRFGEVSVVAAALGLMALGSGVIAGTTVFGVMLVAAGVLGFALAPLGVAFNTLVQRRTPQAIFGRVSASLNLVTAVPQATSVALGAVLVVLLPYQTIFALMAAVVLAASAFIAISLRDQLTSPVPGVTAL